MNEYGGSSSVAEGSQFEPHCRQNMQSLLVVGEGSRTASNHCRGTLEQTTKPTNAHIGPCDEPATPPGVDPVFPHCVPPPDPERDKAGKKMRRMKTFMKFTSKNTFTN